MSVIYRYFLILIACISILLGIQIPSFVDQYEKRLDAHFLEVTNNLRGYQEIAEKFFNGSITELIKKHDPYQHLASVHGEGTFPFRTSPWADFEYAGRAKLAGLPGHESYKLTPEQADAWRKAVAPLEAQWAAGVGKTGVDPKTVMDSLKANLAKYKAGL